MYEKHYLYRNRATANSSNDIAGMVNHECTDIQIYKTFYWIYSARSSKPFFPYLKSE